MTDHKTAARRSRRAPPRPPRHPFSDKWARQFTSTGVLAATGGSSPRVGTSRWFGRRVSGPAVTVAGRSRPGTSSTSPTSRRWPWLKLDEKRSGKVPTPDTRGFSPDKVQSFGWPKPLAEVFDVSDWYYLICTACLGRTLVRGDRLEFLKATRLEIRCPDCGTEYRLPFETEPAEDVEAALDGQDGDSDG